ncbi:MAG: UDP-glucose 4-epimerase GalE [Pleurocapsa sp.]
MTKNQTILVTGGAGYIGSHTVKALKNKGYKVIVLDNLVGGNRQVVEEVLKTKLIVGDISNRSLLARIFAVYPITAVVHLAAHTFIDKSIENSAQYYWNNVTGTLTLLKAMTTASVNKIVFSSAGEVYGIPQTIPITEAHSLYPVELYGKSKLIIEKMLKEFNDIYGLNSIIFRYFNAAGVDRSGLLGENYHPETNFILSVLTASLYQRNSVAIFGTDYPTPDGSYVRDYIHVSDIAQAHVLGLEYILQTESSEIFNLGSNDGFSVKEIMAAASKVTQKKIKLRSCDRSEGELPILVNSSAKAQAILGWQPQYPDLISMISHTWNWYQKSYNLQQPVKVIDRDMLTPIKH